MLYSLRNESRAGCFSMFLEFILLESEFAENGKLSGSNI